MTPEERSVFRAEVARRSNKARGIPEHLQKKALHLYFEKDRTASEVATLLGVSRGAVRGLINRTYTSMTAPERNAYKKRHGSRVRQGARNSNYGKRRRTL